MTYRSILCLNGHLPPQHFFESVNLPLIAADGAANTLRSRGLTPQLVIGDLDSVQADLEGPSLHIQDQNRCDYEKCMEYLEKEDLLPAIILGVNGGDLDHILNNISIFVKSVRGNLLYAPPLYGAVLDSPDHLITLPPHTKISLLGLPEARLTTRGLVWDLRDRKLYFPGVNSCLNRAHASQVHIHVREGKVLFLAHAFFLQA